MPRLRSRFVAVYVVRRGASGGVEFLLLQRPPAHRFAGDWQPVGGHIEEGETAWQAAVREAREETGLEVERWFRIDRLESFYNPENDTIYFVPAFVGLVAADAQPALSDEHCAWRWASAGEAAARVSWQNVRDSILFVAEVLGDPGRPGLGVWEFSPADLEGRAWVAESACWARQGIGGERGNGGEGVNWSRERGDLQCQYVLHAPGAGPSDA